MSPDTQSRLQFFFAQPVPDETPLVKWSPPLGGKAPATYGDVREALAELQQFKDQFHGLLEQLNQTEGRAEALRAEMDRAKAVSSHAAEHKE